MFIKGHGLWVVILPVILLKLGEAQGAGFILGMIAQINVLIILEASELMMPIEQAEFVNLGRFVIRHGTPQGRSPAYFGMIGGI